MLDLYDANKITDGLFLFWSRGCIDKTTFQNTNRPDFSMGTFTKNLILVRPLFSLKNPRVDIIYSIYSSSSYSTLRS